MKKLFSILSVMVLVLGLTACSTESDLKKQIQTLQDQVAELEASIATKDTEISGLNAQIIALQDELFDNVITFTFTDETESTENYTVGYDDDFEGSLYDLLNDNFNVVSSEYSGSHMLLEVEDLSPVTGQYIGVYRNDAFAMVGIDDLTFTDGDIFDFVLAWWDATEEAVDSAITLFLDEQIDNYTSVENLDYNVVAALSLLGMLDDYVTVSEVESWVTSYLEAHEVLSVTDYFKLIVMSQAVGLNTEAYYIALNDIVAPAPYGGTAYGLLGMDTNSHSVDYTDYITLALADLTTTTPSDLGLDSGGISLVALSNYTTETGVDTLISDFASWMSSTQLPSGGILTKDFGWGTSENSSSMAQAALGLIANGYNPAGTDFTKGTNDLMLRLTQYQLENGTFDWILDDGNVTTTFGTPQAFLTLVAYYTYSNNGNIAVNPFDFSE